MNLHLHLAAVIVAASLLLAACDDEPPASVTPAPTTSGGSAAPAAPANLRISGALPDLNQTVTPGEGETGRITLTWQDNSSDEDGFRIYQDCNSQVSTLLELPAGTTTYGPLQTCRPGKIGVASYKSDETSSITWSP